MKKCTYCGKEVEDENEVCPYDGQPLVWKTPPPIPPPSQPARPGIPRPAQPKKSDGLSGIALAAIILGAMCVIGLPTLAILAGLLLPALSKAKSRALEIKCVNNMKQIGLAERIWAGDHDDHFSKKLLDATNELGNPKVLICPADTSANQNSTTWDPDNISYQFVTPGLSVSNADRIVIVRCPIHGTELYGDGSAQMKRSQRQVR